MKSLVTIKRLLGSVLALAILAGAGLAPAVSAVPYDPNGTPTNKTPIFNQFTGVPYGVGNEADFVRVKPKAGSNADFVNNLTSACNANDTYTVRTYIHNGADPKYNTEEGGVAIARNTVVRMTAPLNTPNSTFEFKSTVSSSNAASVTDNGFLTCANGKTVKLSLVEGSVETYSKPIGSKTVPDSSVNGSLAIGSRAQGSGDVYACWEDHVVVYYEVKVVEVPVTPPPPVTPPTTPPVTTPPPVTPPTTTVTTPPASTVSAPSVLPATGPAGVATLAALVSAVSGTGYYVFNRRRTLL